MSRSMITEIMWIERLNSSVNGNPRYAFHTTDGRYVLSSDASYGYQVDNDRRAMLDGRMVTLHLTRAGRVTDITV